MLQDSKTLKDLSIFSDNLFTIHTAMYPHYSGKILFECIDVYGIKISLFTFTQDQA